MRIAMWLLWSSVVCASGAEGAIAGGGIAIEEAQAGQALRFDLSAERPGRYELKVRVEKPDGSVVVLGAEHVEWPRPAREGFYRGPALPRDSGGGTIVVEVFEVATGQRVGTGVAPIGF
ncbi:MAG: hypothetical protein JNM84_06285 [Planctomycetes bacterium]|nr:hypothetical protein [Planctomycetota bacterium]